MIVRHYTKIYYTSYYYFDIVRIAQLVEQRTENPCVGSSSLPLDILIYNEKLLVEYVCQYKKWSNGKKECYSRIKKKHQ